MIDRETYYIGTELKLAITITCEGFDMNEDPWKVTVVGEKGSVLCVHGDSPISDINIVSDDNDQWYLLVDTAKLGKGTVYAVIEIDVHDDDFDDGLRHEVYKQKLWTIKNV